MIRKFTSTIALLLMLSMITGVAYTTPSYEVELTELDVEEVISDVDNLMVEDEAIEVDAEETEALEETEEVEEIDESEEEEDTEEDEDSTSTTVTGTNKYYIKINITKQVVTVYSKDSDGNYTIPVIAFVCSTGSATPSSGVYTTSSKYRWHTLNGGVYGQYCTRIYNGILFHSVPCSTYGEPGSVYAKYYDQLGTAASAGCVRLTVAGAKWIYENCASGTQVEFYKSSESGPLAAETPLKISGMEGDLKYWDPTDPDPDNPWIAYLAGLSTEEEDTTTDSDTGSTTEPDTGGTTEPDEGSTTEPDDGSTTEPDTGGTTEPDDGSTTEPDTGGTAEPDDGSTTEPDDGSTIE